MNTYKTSNSSMLVKGFTIVELLIVIAIVGILATITMVGYSGTQARTRDSVRMHDLSVIKDALELHNAKEGDWVEAGSGCGYNGDGGGWFNHVNGSTYMKSISNCLLEGEYIKSDIIDPTGGTTSSPTSGFSYMKYHCGSGSSLRVFVYAKLENQPQDSTATDGTCSSTLDTSYGMNYYIQVK